MNILLFNQSWLSAELRELGQRVFTVGQAPGHFDLAVAQPIVELTSVLSLLPQDFRPDRIVYYDNSSLPWVTGFFQSKIPSVYYSVDAHLHPKWHPPYSAVFDACLVAQKSYLHAFSPYHPSVTWFPPWASIPRKRQHERALGASFRGTLGSDPESERQKFFATVSSLAPIDYQSGPFEEVYANSKIVLNHCVKDDLNFRVFEALACGAMLITPRCDNGILDLFRDGCDLVTYRPNDPQDAAEKVNYYLAHGSEREVIAQSGHRRIRDRHTPMHRARELFDILLPLKRGSERPRYVGAAYGTLTSASVWGDRGHWPKLLLNNSSEALIESVAREEWDFVETVACIMLCQDFLEMSGHKPEALSFLKRLSESKPQNGVLRMLHIDALQRSNLQSEAIQLAHQSSDDPEQLLNTLPTLIKTLRAESRYWFYGEEDSCEQT